jgi:hypothetical protein
MDNYYQPPLIPGMGQSGMNPYQGNYAAQGSPFFTVANQFLPRNLHDVIRWARYITTWSPVTTEVIRKLATYPITEFTVDTNNKETKMKYEQIFDSYKLKSALHDIGFDFYTLGNVFVSIYFPIHRTLTCPNCSSAYNAKQADFLNFRHFEFHGSCPKCGFTGNFERTDTKSFNIPDMNLIKWDPVNIAVNHNPITNEYEYYYRIPNEIRRRCRQGDKLFVNSVPWEFIEAIKNNQDFKFEKNSIYHLKNVSAGHMIEGVAIPPLISIYSLVWYQATLRKANEAISTDFMSPMRVIYPAAQTGNSDPVVSISMRNFVARIQDAMKRHKQDNNHVLIAPVPIGYQAISGEGKTLLVAAEIQQAEEQILLSLGVSRELLSGQTNWTSSTVGLRLLQNTLECYTGQIIDLIRWIMARSTTYLSLENVKIDLVPFKLTDDDMLRQFLLQMVQAGEGSASTLYESYGMDYKEELDRMKDDAIATARNKIETQVEIEHAEFLAAKIAGDMFDRNTEYKTVLAKAQEAAQQLQTMDGQTQRLALNEMKLTDYTSYLMTMKILQDEQEQVNAEQEQEAKLQGMAAGVQDPNAEGAGEGGGEGENGKENRGDRKGPQGPGKNQQGPRKESKPPVAAKKEQ